MKKYKLIMLSLVALAGMTSCNKLDLQPTDAFTDENSFRNLSDLQLGTNAIYGRYGAYASDMYVSALLSDEAKLGKDNAGQGALTYRYQYSSDGTTGGDVVGAFGSYYSLIDQTNRVLAAIVKVNVLPGEQAREDVLKGQNLAMRALGHYGLLQAYCKNYDPNDPLGVPVMTESRPDAKPARSSQAQVMTQILSDLWDAKSLLLMEPFSDTVMNRYNVEAYLARIYLYRGDFDSAAYYAESVINAGVQSLANSSDFGGVWTDLNNLETLFRIRYATSTAIGGLWTTTGSNIYIAPSDKLRSQYSSSDVRLNTYIGLDGTGAPYVNKFYTSGRGGRVVDMKACRIAEMYLISAEANAKKPAANLSLAADRLNQLRTKRISGYSNQTFSGAQEISDAVLLERYKELCFEGFRFWDLKRNNLPVQRLSSDANPDWQTLPVGDYRFVLPIPRDELNANPNMVQNPGY
jgi:hypothetical protein